MDPVDLSRLCQMSTAISALAFLCGDADVLALFLQLQPHGRHRRTALDMSG
jgi:hypothetical protein